MKILVIGSGAREHALAWKLAAEPGVSQVICAPGNAGIAQDAACFPVAADKIAALVALGTWYRRRKHRRAGPRGHELASVSGVCT